MDGTSDPLAPLDEATRRYRRTEKAHEQSREAVIAAVVAALKAGQRPTEVVKRSPFTDAYVRRIARANNIQPQAKGRRDEPSARRPS